MRYSPDTYAEVFMDALQGIHGESEKKALHNFVGLVSKNGDMSRMARIIEIIERRIAVSHKAHTIEITSARALPERVESQLRALGGTNDIMSFRVDPTLIAGLRVTINGELEYSNAVSHTLQKLFS